MWDDGTSSTDTSGPSTSDGSDWTSIFSGTLDNYFKYRTTQVAADSYNHGDRNVPYQVGANGMLYHQPSQYAVGSAAGGGNSSMMLILLGAAVLVAVVLVSRRRG